MIHICVYISMFLCLYSMSVYIYVSICLLLSTLLNVFLELMAFINMFHIQCIPKI